MGTYVIISITAGVVGLSVFALWWEARHTRQKKHKKKKKKKRSTV